MKEKELQKKLLLFKPFEPVVCPSPRFGAGFGKPNFPFNVDKSISLSELNTKDSCFFHIMQIDSSILLENPGSWRSLNSYQSGLKNIGAIKVLNYCAEWGVKLGVDFAPYARSSRSDKRSSQTSSKHL